MSQDVNILCHHSLLIYADLSPANASICPLWAPIHQPLIHGRGLGRRDHLLLKCLERWGKVGILTRHFFFNLEQDIWANVAVKDPPDKGLICEI